MNIQTIDWDTFLKHRANELLVDVRSPAEYAVDHPTGAMSVPLVDNDQRAMVGTLYSQLGSNAAFAQARGVIRSRVVDLVSAVLTARPGLELTESDVLEGFDEIVGELFASKATGGKKQSQQINPIPYSADRWRTDKDANNPPIFVYCWRGGLRSGSFTILLEKLGLNAVQVVGGYRNYRRVVVRYLEETPVPRLFVLDGLTGTGKTDLLHAIAERYPRHVLDYEHLAQHRASLLGAVGLKPVTKKAFDSALVGAAQIRSKQFLIVEGESRKIGGVEIPSTWWQAMRTGTRIQITTSLENRAIRLAQEYSKSRQLTELTTALEKVLARLAPKIASPIRDSFIEGEYEAVALELLRQYYDPRYKHSMARHDIHHKIDANDISRAVDSVVQIIEAAGESFDAEPLSN